jgi:hypothetical protein
MYASTRKKKQRFSPEAALLTCIVSAGLIGCGTDEITNPDPGSFDLGGLYVMQGQNEHTILAVRRDGGFVGPIRLTVSGAPPGVTVAFHPATIAAGEFESWVAVAVDQTAAGQYPMIITGSGASTADQSATLTLTVTPKPAISIAVNPAGLVIMPPGAAKTSTITLTRASGFAGDVQLAVSTNDWTGLTATLSPNIVSVGEDSAVLAVSASVGADRGCDLLTVTASAPEVPDAITTMTVLISTDPGADGCKWDYGAPKASESAIWERGITDVVARPFRFATSRGSYIAGVEGAP